MTRYTRPLPRQIAITTPCRGNGKPITARRIEQLPRITTLPHLIITFPKTRGNVVMAQDRPKNPMDSTKPITTPPVVMRGNRGNGHNAPRAPD